MDTLSGRDMFAALGRSVPGLSFSLRPASSMDDRPQRTGNWQTSWRSVIRAFPLMAIASLRRMEMFGPAPGFRRGLISLWQWLRKTTATRWHWKSRAAWCCSCVAAEARASSVRNLQPRQRDHQPIRELIAWISEHLDADLSVPALARRVGMSERNFSRVFTQQVSTTPARFVARLRTEAAKAKLAATPEKLEAIAQSAGFGDSETLRRHLQDDRGASLSSERSRPSYRLAL